MIILPKDIEDIIFEYKKQIEYQELVKKHSKKYNKCLIHIKKSKNISYSSYRNRNERTITIGPFFHSKRDYVYCLCFRICLRCNDIKESSRMYHNEIGNHCLCY